MENVGLRVSYVNQHVLPAATCWTTSNVPVTVAAHTLTPRNLHCFLFKASLQTNTCNVLAKHKPCVCFYNHGKPALNLCFTNSNVFGEYQFNLPQSFSLDPRLLCFYQEEPVFQSPDAQVLCRLHTIRGSLLTSDHLGHSLTRGTTAALQMRWVGIRRHASHEKVHDARRKTTLSELRVHSTLTFSGQRTSKAPEGRSATFLGSRV